LAWLIVLLLPMLAIVQAIAASVAGASQMSLQQAIVRTYGRFPAVVALVCVVGIGLFTLIADVAAGAQALTLLTGIPYPYFVVPFVGAVAVLLATTSYVKIERTLAFVTLIFLCYVASAVLAHPDWREVLTGILIPRFPLTPEFLTGAIALLGTTLTGYVYYWESIEIAERRPERSALKAVTTDAALGMLVAGSSFLFILVATAATSGKHHLAIRTAADAAAALQPLAGSLDQALFGIGLLASAAIAVPVIAATGGYVVAQTFERRASLTLRPKEAPFFYAVIFASLGLAAILALLPFPTMELLYWSSVAAGLATPVTLALTMLVARNWTAMRGTPIGIPLVCAGWAVTALVTLASVGFLSATLSLRTF
jgi:Mn2+/Fe2+ NRAMP family transporter